MMVIVLVGRIQIHGVPIHRERKTPFFLEIVSRSNYELNEITVSNKYRTFYFFLLLFFLMLSYGFGITCLNSILKFHFGLRLERCSNSG